MLVLKNKNKIKKKEMKKLIFPLVIVALLFWVFADKCNYSSLSNEFKVKQDSLVHAVDSLQEDIHQKDLEINVLHELDNDLEIQLEEAKGKVKVITKWIDSSVKKVDTYTEQELVSSFNKRYPTDTITNPLPLAQPVLVSAAKDLIELDGVKEEIVVKNDIIALNEQRIVGKDSVISLYVQKETNYKSIVNNQESQIKDWKSQYNNLQLENHKLKIKNKFTKLAAGIVIGGLTYLIISK
jgi:hypothetical protein